MPLLVHKLSPLLWRLNLSVTSMETNLYKWSIHWSDNQKEIKQQQLQTDRIKKRLVIFILKK